MGHTSPTANINQESVQESSQNTSSSQKSSSVSSKQEQNSKPLRRTSSKGAVILLESPDLVLDSHSRFNLSSFRTYFECSGPWRVLVSNRRQESND